MKILIVGKNGQLGKEIQEAAKKELDYEYTFLGKSELDITDQKAVSKLLNIEHFDIVINAAAYTNVDEAETQLSAAEKVNRFGPKNLAWACKETGTKLIHISTDYCFGVTKTKPLKEDDDVGPINNYGKTKLEGEIEIKRISPDGVIIRTSWLYSAYNKNFVKSMIKLGSEKEELNIIFDQIGTPTWTKDLVSAIFVIIKKGSFRGIETFHYSNEGVSSWYDFSLSIFEEINSNITISPILSKDFPTPAKRPNFTVLDKSKIKKQFNIEIPHWRESLKKCIKQIRNT